MQTRSIDSIQKNLGFTRITRAARLAFGCATVAIVSACGGEKAADTAADSTRVATRDPNSPIAVVDQGLSTPESVLWDGMRNVWYISNINGGPQEKDDNGYIVRVGPDGQKSDSMPFINGADDDIMLHAPKGMAILGDTLWVADIDALRGFDLVSGTQVASVDLQSRRATFLNDVTVGPDGTIYITDTGVTFDAAGNARHTGASRVFSLRGRTVSEAVVLPRESGANGISWDPAREAFVIASFATPDVFTWKPGSKTAIAAGKGPGGGDGIIVLADGRVVISSWADSSLTVVGMDGAAPATLRKGLPSPADIGYDAARHVMAVPLFTGNRVEFWSVGEEGPRQP